MAIPLKVSYLLSMQIPDILTGRRLYSLIMMQKGKGYGLETNVPYYQPVLTNETHIVI